MNGTTPSNDELQYDVHAHDDSNQYETHEYTPKYDQALIDDIFGISDDGDDFKDVNNLKYTHHLIQQKQNMTCLTLIHPCCVEVVEITNLANGIENVVCSIITPTCLK